VHDDKVIQLVQIDIHLRSPGSWAGLPACAKAGRHSIDLRTRRGRLSRVRNPALLPPIPSHFHSETRGGSSETMLERRHPVSARALRLSRCATDRLPRDPAPVPSSRDSSNSPAGCATTNRILTARCRHSPLEYASLQCIVLARYVHRYW
jgi:hypothetical protein